MRSSSRLTTSPLAPAGSRRANSRASTTGARRLIASWRSHCSTVKSVARSRSKMAALLTRTVTGPSAACAAATSASTCAGSPRSAWTGAALPPARFDLGRQLLRLDSPRRDGESRRHSRGRPASGRGAPRCGGRRRSPVPRPQPARASAPSCTPARLRAEARARSRSRQGSIVRHAAPTIDGRPRIAHRASAPARRRRTPAGRGARAAA